MAKTIRVDTETWTTLRIHSFHRGVTTAALVRELAGGLAEIPSVVVPRRVAPVEPTRPVASAGLTHATTTASSAPIVPPVAGRTSTDSWTRTPIPKSLSSRKRGPGVPTTRAGVEAQLSALGIGTPPRVAEALADMDEDEPEGEDPVA